MVAYFPKYERVVHNRILVGNKSTNMNLTDIEEEEIGQLWIVYLFIWLKHIHVPISSNHDDPGFYQRPNQL